MPAAARAARVSPRRPSRSSRPVGLPLRPRPAHPPARRVSSSPGCCDVTHSHGVAPGARASASGRPGRSCRSEARRSDPAGRRGFAPHRQRSRPQSGEAPDSRGISSMSERASRWARSRRHREPQHPGSLHRRHPSRDGARSARPAARFRYPAAGRSARSGLGVRPVKLLRAPLAALPGAHRPQRTGSTLPAGPPRRLAIGSLATFARAHSQHLQRTSWRICCSP